MHRLTSSRMIFDEITPADAPELVAWRSDPNVIRYLNEPVEITLESHTKWYYENYLNDPTRVDFIMKDRTTQTKIGTAGLKNIDNILHTCDISYMIANADYLQKGYGKEANTALCKWAAHLGLKSIFAVIHTDNVASKMLILKMGFQYLSTENGFERYSRSLHQSP